MDVQVVKKNPKHLHLFFDTECKENNVVEKYCPHFFRLNEYSQWKSNFNRYRFLKDNEEFEYFHDMMFQAR